MKDIIKIIYYLLFNCNISISEILKLIRYNIFFEIYFNLKFYEGEGKYILKDIIENCGGEIIEENKNNIFNNDNKKIFYVCKKEDYSFLKDKIKKELMEYKNSKIVTEKYVLDSFYFMTNLENELNESEYFINDNEDYDY